MSKSRISADSCSPSNVLITGGAGFIASHVILLLVKKYPNIHIVNLDKLDYCSCLANLDEISDLPNYKFVKGNICSSELVSYVLKEEKIDTIMHFAAQTHVDNSFDEVYGEQHMNQDAMDEEQVLEPTNPYAATKAGAEFMVKAYIRSFNMPIIITRGNNVYGPHQFPEKLIPKFINQICRGKAVTVHGTGLNMRNFLYVEDVARAFEIVLFKGEVGQIYNIGGTQERKNIEVTRDLLTLSGYVTPEQQQTMITYVEDRAFNDLRYHINSDKLAALGWKELVKWEDGLKMTYDWYMKNSHRYGNIDAALVAHPRFGMADSH